MIRVLFVNDEPIPPLYREAFSVCGIHADIIIAHNAHEARMFLPHASKIAAVFIDYDLGAGYGHDVLSSGLLQLFLLAGFGTEEHLLVANSASRRSNLNLMSAGCNYFTQPNQLDYFVRTHSKRWLSQP